MPLRDRVKKFVDSGAGLWRRLRHAVARTGIICRSIRLFGVSQNRLETNAPSPPEVALFGKHPGWSDHISLPLPTAALRNLRQVVYHIGIQSIIERGLWANLPEADLIPFGHWFAAGHGNAWVVGRFWASADKIGRRDYPMVACIDFANAPVTRAIEFASPILRELETACRSATTSADVLRSLETSRAKVGQWTGTGPAPPTHESAVRILESHDDLKAVNQPLLRVLSAWAPLLDRGIGQMILSREKPVAPAPVRVPWCAENVEAALTRWAHFCTEIAGSKYPTFLASPDGHRWIDVILGQPGPEDLAVLRRSAGSFPSIVDRAEEKHSDSFLRWASGRLVRSKNAEERSDEMTKPESPNE